MNAELIYDKEYYTNVFKKTEKIVASLFFLLDIQRSSPVIEKDILSRELERISTQLLEASSKLLVLSRQMAETHSLEYTRLLIHVGALLESAMASNRIERSYGSMISHEIDLLLRFFDQFMHSTTKNSFERFGLGVVQNENIRVVSPRSRRGVPPTEENQNEIVRDRKDRIRDVLRNKGQVSIKDISDIIRDVSEKSIQRDLNFMIENGEVLRTGKKRWSLYALSVY